MLKDTKARCCVVALWQGWTFWLSEGRPTFLIDLWQWWQDLEEIESLTRQDLRRREPMDANVERSEYMRVFRGIARSRYRNGLSVVPPEEGNAVAAGRWDARVRAQSVSE